ncbi:LpqB family beta-propeller domain-containing protein [Micromonospora sp. SL4-19]|uniref:LpqB family beta-propeller domain-containing protein n=1 Tax=Micromonospora sp. SL4-19 TaxID=3399129 RepID=UPI003A4D9205
MRPRLLPILLAGVLLPAGLAGCGIPHETDVHVDGRFGQAAESGALGGSASPPPGPTAKDPKEFILNYLSAAAGEREQAYNRVKQFTAPEAQGWLKGKQSNDPLYVIRLREQPEATRNNEGTYKVTVKVQQLGVLRAQDGVLASPGTPVADTEYTFMLREAREGEGESGWRITGDPPQKLLLSDEALGSYYAPQTIYFWSGTNQTRLVPDQRYLPKALPVERQVTEVVKWLAAGPQDWLASGVLRLPDQTSPINNATRSDGRWEVNLRSGADDKRLARLATQLAWSVPEQVTGELDLKIQDQSRTIVDINQEKSAHQNYPFEGNPQRFCIYDGAIHPLSLTDGPPGSVPVDAPQNRSIVTAALSRSDGKIDGKILAALVTTRADRLQQLKVGSGPGPVTDFRAEKRWFTSVSRPTWLRSLDPQHPYGLVAADGDLYRFDGSGKLTQVPLGVGGKVTAVAASADGHRVALVINRALYVAVVSTDGGLGSPRPVVTKLTDITAVDWYAENRLVFAGSEPRGGTREGRPAISASNIDGAREAALDTDIGAQVTNLSAYPGPEVAGVMYEANKVAYRSNPSKTPIVRAQVQDVTPPPTGTKVADPTAPFFLY